MKNIIGLIDQEEHYQFLRTILDQMSPRQRESTIDLFKTLFSLPKKQINMLAGLIDRYRLEEIETIYSALELSKHEEVYLILEELAASEGVTIARNKVMQRSNGKSMATYDSQQMVINVDESLSADRLNFAIANRLVYALMEYSRDIRDKVPRRLKQTTDIGMMLIEGIKYGLSVRQ